MPLGLGDRFQDLDAKLTKFTTTKGGNVLMPCHLKKMFQVCC